MARTRSFDETQSLAVAERPARWQPCFQKICGRLSRRDVDATNAECSHAGSRSFPQTQVQAAEELRALRRHCAALGRLLPASIDGRVAEGWAAVAAIQERIDELEGLLAASQQRGPQLLPSNSRNSSVSCASSRDSASARLHDVVPCKVLSEGSTQGEGKIWVAGRLFLSDVGLSFHEEGGLRNNVKDIFWEDVVSMASTTPPPSRGGSFFFWRSRSFNSDDSHEVNLELRSAPGSFQVQFGISQPVNDLKALWNISQGDDNFSSVIEESSDDAGAAQAGGDASDPASFRGCPVLADFKRCAGPPQVVQTPLKTMTMNGAGVTLAAVRAQLLRNDESWPVLDIWKGDNAEVLDLSPWEPLADGEGLMRRMHLRLPLKPMPMAPKSTRISIVYHLKGGENGEPLVFSDRSYSIDVPYSTCFRVQGSNTFIDGGEAGISVTRTLGLDWSARTMLKGVIEKAARGEGMLFFEKLIDHMEEELTSPTES